jgi:pyruvate/2-oxoglutarate dehydrogenase complex dihydrolipoamide dehydrogenase (E3) component
LLLAGFPFILPARSCGACKPSQAPARPAPAREFDTNLVVIGAGSAGLVAALIAATLRPGDADRAHKMGGDCLNTGCVPSKAILRSAARRGEMRRARSSAWRRWRCAWTFAR